MIICLEGPSAVGKTTLAAMLADEYQATAIPEANALFERPAQETPTGYFECQVRRWQIALQEDGPNHLVVLDGDPFQPLWYNWAYDYIGWQTLTVTAQFYREQIELQRLGFPDLYCVLQADEAALRGRKASDTARLRRGFEKHLEFISPQRRYFAEMQRLSSSRVAFVIANDVSNSIVQIRELAEKAGSQSTNLDASLLLFSQMVEWLQSHSADETALPHGKLLAPWNNLENGVV